jgi:hypothetical protein
MEQVQQPTQEDTVVLFQASARDSRGRATLSLLKDGTWILAASMRSSAQPPSLSDMQAITQTLTFRLRESVAVLLDTRTET